MPCCRSPLNAMPYFSTCGDGSRTMSSELNEEQRSKVVSFLFFSFSRLYHVLQENGLLCDLAFNTDVHLCSKLIICNYLVFLKILIVVLKNKQKAKFAILPHTLIQSFFHGLRARDTLQLRPPSSQFINSLRSLTCSSSYHRVNVRQDCLILLTGEFKGISVLLNTSGDRTRAAPCRIQGRVNRKNIASSTITGVLFKSLLSVQIYKVDFKLTH